MHPGKTRLRLPSAVWRHSFNEQTTVGVREFYPILMKHTENNYRKNRTEDFHGELFGKK